MIEIGSGYYIIPTKFGYDLAQKNINKKTGEERLDPISYHGSLTACLNAALGEFQRKKLSETECYLPEAIAIMDQMQKRFEEILKYAVQNKESVGNQE